MIFALKTLIKNMHMYIYLAFIIALTYLSINLYYAKHEIQHLNLIIKDYESQIDLLKKESDLYKEKVLIASEKAQLNMDKTIIASNSILHENVSTNCEAAIQWGIKKSLEL